MKNIQELKEFVKGIKSKYPDYATNPNAVAEVRNHPDYSHNTIRQSWEDNNVYFYVDNCPNRVWHAITFNKSMLEHLESPLDIAINNKW